MMLIHYLINKAIILDNENKVNVLVIENQNFFTEVLTDLSNQIFKMKGKFVLSINNVPVEIYKNMELITEFIPFDINKKSLVNRLLKRADMIAQNEEFILRTKELYTYINAYALALAEEINYDIDFLHAFDVSAILKAIEFRFSNDYITIAQKIFEYMLRAREFEGDKCFVLVNIRNYINDDEIDDFYKTILYNKLKVLVVSANDYPYSQFEEKIIIDKDLCEV